MILKWLGKRSGAPQEDTASVFLDTLTGSPAAVLQQVFDWIEEQDKGDEASLKMLLQADMRLAPVLAEIEAGLAANRRIGTGYKLLRTYCERFARAYARIALGLPKGHAEKLISTLRATWLFSRACRLARMTYNDPAELRRENLALYLEVQQLDIVAKRQAPYPDTPETSVRQELGISLLWETAPFDTLTLEQIDYLERFMIFFGHQIILKSVPGSATPYAVAQDGRILSSGNETNDAAVLFVGPGTLAGLMAGVVKHKEADPLPAWAGTPLPHTDIQTLKTLARRILTAWEQRQIQRDSERKKRDDKVLVTGGVLNIRRAVAYAAYVRNGGQLEAYDTRGLVLDERVRGIMVGLQESGKQLTPIEILAAMEAIGDSNAIESWSTDDSSERGYSLIVPGFRSWLAVGSLLGIRESGRIDWHVAMVRRLYGPASARHVGVEIFRGIPLPVGMGGAGQTKDVSLADLSDAILIDGETDHLLVTTIDCTPESIHLVVGQQGRNLYRINTRYSGTADYQIYLCQPVQQQA